MRSRRRRFVFALITSPLQPMDVSSDLRCVQPPFGSGLSRGRIGAPRHTAPGSMARPPTTHAWQSAEACTRDAPRPIPDTEKPPISQGSPWRRPPANHPDWALPCRRYPPVSAGKTTSSGRLSDVARAIASSRKAGHTTVRLSCVFGVPTTTSPLTVTALEVMFSLRRDRSMSATLSPVSLGSGA